ncbi:serine/threonine protein phosphatase [Flammeovirga kamogawensis]|nr:serine/threonine protein phosphatase [Flammeovirga kamogawensis]
MHYLFYLISPFVKALKLKTKTYLRRFAVGDIHGCYKTFKFLLEDELKITTQDVIFLVGDYIHKGPNSEKVIDYIIDLQKDGYNIFPIRGNHEENLINRQRTYRPTFARFIAKMNTRYGKSILSKDGELYLKHKEFFKALPYRIQIEDYHIVHAGFNYDAEKPKKDFDAMLNTRKPLPDILPKMLKKRRVIHGHTPISIEKIKQNITDHYPLINIDSGCAFFKKITHEQVNQLGYLSCFNLDTQTLITVRNKDQEPQFLNTVPAYH